MVALHSRGEPRTLCGRQTPRAAGLEHCSTAGDSDCPRASAARCCGPAATYATGPRLAFGPQIAAAPLIPLCRQPLRVGLRLSWRAIGGASRFVRVLLNTPGVRDDAGQHLAARAQLSGYVLLASHSRYRFLFLSLTRSWLLSTFPAGSILSSGLGYLTTSSFMAVALLLRTTHVASSLQFRPSEPNVATTSGSSQRQQAALYTTASGGPSWQLRRSTRQPSEQAPREFSVIILD